MSAATTSSNGAPGPRVGFIGMGRMGVPMARNLLGAGFELSVFNRTSEKCEPLVDAGAQAAPSPAALAAESDVVITSLADGDAVADVVGGPEGVAEGISPEAMLIEMSTIGPVRARELASRLQDIGAGMVDAPVSGSVALAASATLTAVAGGATQDFERALPVLRAITKAQFHVGPVGAGAAMKLALNLIIASTTHSVSEALVIAEGSDIDRESAYEVIEQSAVASPFVRYKRAAFLDPDGEPVAFSLDLMRKDLDLALELGHSAGVPMLSASAASEAIGLAIGLEGGDRDLVGLADALRLVSRGKASEGAQ
jgi:3-hydroxyisobutyrate dehydrogenase